MTLLVLHGSHSPLLVLLFGLSTVVTVWLISVAVFRRFFHPLAKIPGHFLAAITHFYIVKFNLFGPRSQFYLQVEKLHREYGKQIWELAPLFYLAL
jgi:hypothetical protein